MTCDTTVISIPLQCTLFIIFYNYSDSVLSDTMAIGGAFGTMLSHIHFPKKCIRDGNLVFTRIQLYNTIYNRVKYEALAKLLICT